MLLLFSQTGVFTGVFLAVLLGTWYGFIAELFTKDIEVLGVVRSGILFVSATQPINALAFVFDGLHYGVSDFSYAAFAMMAVGTMSSAFLVYAPSNFGLPGIWFGLTLFMLLRMVAGFVR
ncbi:Protein DETOXIFICATION 45, chloroplastic [Asimina triloba]